MAYLVEAEMSEPLDLDRLQQLLQARGSASILTRDLFRQYTLPGVSDKVTPEYWRSIKNAERERNEIKRLDREINLIQKIIDRAQDEKEYMERSKKEEAEAKKKADKVKEQAGKKHTKA